MAKSSKSETSNDSKNIIVILLLLFLYPIGLILMWAWTKWPKWVKIVISSPLIIAIVSIVVAVLVLVVLPKNNANYQPPGITKSLPNVSKYQDIQTQTKDAKVKTDFKLLQQALAQYNKDKGKYPQSLNQLNENGTLYIIPQSPYPNAQYNYQASGKTYTLSTTLGDGSNYSVSP